MPKRVLFVCMGNICRSPTGEGVFRHFVENQGLAHEVEIDSAGTIGYHVGEPPDSRMQRAAARRNYDLSKQRARQFKRSDFVEFDLIVPMDRENEWNIHRLDPDAEYREKVKLLCSFHPNPPTMDVPDPYYGGQRGFEEVLDLIEAACPGILEHLQSLDQNGKGD